jgi:hypothetical protein
MPAANTRRGSFVALVGGKLPTTLVEKIAVAVANANGCR